MKALTIYEGTALPEVKWPTVTFDRFVDLVVAPSVDQRPSLLFRRFWFAPLLPLMRSCQILMVVGRMLSISFYSTNAITKKRVL